MTRLELERRVAAPAEAVWAVMTDLDASPQVLSGVDRIERVAGGPGFGVGTRWRETRTLLRRQATAELEVTGYAPGRSYTVESESGGAHYRSVLAVEPEGERASRLSMTFGAEPEGLPAKVAANTVGRLFMGVTRRALQRDLEDIAAAAERRAARP